MEVTKLPEQTPRIETGPIQFGSDWPGVFFRGDHALHFAHALQEMINNFEILVNSEQIDKTKVHYDVIRIALLRGLIDTLQECDARLLK